jgi:hypothetical protein
MCVILLCQNACSSWHCLARAFERASACSDSWVDCTAHDMPRACSLSHLVTVSQRRCRINLCFMILQGCHLAAAGDLP